VMMRESREGECGLFACVHVQVPAVQDSGVGTSLHSL
jgi:hypothetical protein